MKNEIKIYGKLTSGTVDGIICSASNIETTFPDNESEYSYASVQDILDEWSDKLSAEGLEFTGSSYYDSDIDNVYSALDYLGQAAIGRYSVESNLSSLNANSTIAVDPNDLGLLPRDGYQYNLGTISSLVFSNNMGAMKLGTTFVFTANANTSDFTIVLPYIHDDSSPLVEARMLNWDRLDCLAGNTYLLTITAVCGPSGNPINVFNLQTLTLPTESSNNIS